MHDAAGNLTDDGVRTYAWDAEQRLVRIGYTGTSRSTEFRYDAFGRRTAVVERDGTTATEARYLWCGERICQARDGADTVTRRYYDEGELAVSATGDVATFYAEDHLGSIRDLRMGDGQVLASYDYDPYGAPTRSDETGGVHADYRYAGLVHHAPSGLYLANYRAYSAQHGRWISRDPIFEAGGVNLYAYVGNSPINLNDRLGLWSFSFGAYAGPGGAITFGRDPTTGQWFYGGRVGIGFGGGASFDPQGQRPGGTNGSNSCHGTTFGTFINFGGNLGPYQWDPFDAHGGYDSTTGNGYSEGPFNNRMTFGNGDGMEFGGAFGVEIVGH
jgi:RHS repeat-associated protein